LPISPPDDPYLPFIRQVFRIEDVTWGTEKQNFLVRYRGQLVQESEAAYEKLSASLRVLDVTPLFRMDGDRQSVIILRGVVRPRPSNPWINLLLFVLTGISVIFAGTFFRYAGPLSTNLDEVLPYLIPALLDGSAFAVCLLAILLAHEFGHYLAARYHRSAVTLPYFIPFPLSPFGTMGAFIQLKEPPRNKRILLDIGLAGPLAGLVIAIPVLLIGLYLSDLGNLPLPSRLGQSFQLEGNSIFYLISKYVIFGHWLPEPVSYNGLNPILYWLRYFFTGRPVPFGGEDVLLHPIAYAGWSGLLVTALNLIPAGQLDGGHALYVLLGKRVRAILPFILIALIALGFVWSGWWLWAFIIYLLGRVYAEPLDQITPLDGQRKALAVFGLLLFFLLFTPIPLSFY
jgi:Zn-dependent protease